MYALTVKQPWAEAIARHGKTVVSQTRRPPEHLIGQRIAIHVGQAWSDMLTPMSIDLIRWTADMLVKGNPPNAGRIVATARLSGVLVNVGNGVVCSWVNGSETAEDIMASSAARRGPWFTGPVGWVLADVRPLAVPVDGGHTSRFEGCRRDCFSEGCPMCDGRSSVYTRIPIRGQAYPFALSPEVEAAILRQEASHG